MMISRYFFAIGDRVKNKNCSKLDQKSSKIGFVTLKIVVYCNKLTKITILRSERIFV